MKKLFIIIFVALSFASCNDDILNLEPMDRVAESAVWSDKQLIYAYQAELYRGINHGYVVMMQSKATDEAVYNQPWGAGAVIRGTMTVDDPFPVMSWQAKNWEGGCRLHVWDNHYLYIRKINVFFDKMAKTDVVFDAGEKEKLIAEARVIRAYMYWELAIRFNGCPLIGDKVNSLDDNASFTRSTFDQVIAYVETELAAAMPDLPAFAHPNNAYMGRMNQSIIKGMLSRMYLYLASPMFSPTKSNAKWQKAADAAMDLIDDGNYSLHPNVKTLFSEASGSANNEIIWTRQFSTSDFHIFPNDHLGRRWTGYGGWWASNGPSQNLVDDFDMINGEQAFTHVNYVPTTTINPASGYDPQNPYANRDPRFDAWIDHDGTLQGGIILQKYLNSDGTWGYDSYKQSGDNPRCNYTIGKFVPAVGVPLNRQTPYTNPWIFIRLGEIYLNYAEAMFELGNEGVCREYINKIRTRAGMPDIPATVTGDDLRQRLYNERRIELCFEEHRYFDVRRWDIAKYTEPLTLRGMQITRDVVTGVKTYASEDLQARVPYDEKYDWLPISTEELRRTNYTITQTPGW